jgi:predicted O-methyltransferase YrrM
MKNSTDLKRFVPTKSIVPRNKLDIFLRKIKIFLLIVANKNFRNILKANTNKAYREYLVEKLSVKNISVNQIVDWSRLSLKFSNVTSNLGQTSHLELLCILALTIENIGGSNFLEIGTYDGNTAFAIANNLPEGSIVITIDLPEDTSHAAIFDYDNFLVHNQNRAQKKHLTLKNVKQIYMDSTKVDFSEFNFNIAFIDGGHDFATVRSDTSNVLSYIKSPGIILWHDYDVECEIGDLLHHLAKDASVMHIEGTRLAYLKV